MLYRNAWLTHWVCALFLLALVALPGCAGLSKYPVDGKVIWEDGSPATELAGFSITFEHEDGVHSASGVVGPDGKFTVGTESESDGAVPGKHRVAISPPPPVVDKPIPPPIIRREYGDFANSGLTAEVKAGNNPIELKVQRIAK